MSLQNTSTLLMIAPTNFGFNEEAYLTNKFQQVPSKEESGSLQEKALGEFQKFVEQLKNHDVDVSVYQDRPQSTTPDSIFPNNWISTHRTGELLTYPMAVSNRRNERRQDIIDELVSKYRYNKIDLTFHEKDAKPLFLEGTGSLIFDHDSKVVYAAISSRTSATVLQEVAEKLNYEAVSFNAYGKENELIYHTNVMMSVGNTFIIGGFDTIDKEDRTLVIRQIKKSGKEIIELSNDQIHNHFAGNMLQVQNRQGETILVMSQNAFDSLSEKQIQTFKHHNDHILAVSIPTIEKIGGGSARCMLAEIFIPAL